ncbi:MULTISPECIES: hypothetical protein [Staphylococcus]|nr:MULTISPECIES: hypothetical protein [Staphylococcus]MDU6092490.1 hypothetical protein [Staphylococcus lugdunensis]HCU7193664.1 hypothetical protein [Staphylococcus aureus]HCV0270552.1 hypothetical protein [Staphylococcus aureus]HDD6623549.1 hypothetical protein [Staphylococcus aureus]HEI6472500.1 hypothetical protein [Staphylococcus aureus]
MTAKVTQQDNNKLKKQVQQIMEVNNEDYQEWLFQKHQEYLSENNDIITKALKLLSQSNQDNTYEN